MKRSRMKRDFKTILQCITLLLGIVICMLVCDSDRIREEDYINKIYLVDQGDSYGYKFSIYITSLEQQKVEGFAFSGCMADPWSGCYLIEGERNKERMHGIYADSKGNKTDLILDFLPDSRIQASIPVTKEQYLLRPYRVADDPEENIYEELSGEIELETWGKVQLINTMSNTRHPIAGAYLANEKGEAIYSFGYPFMNGLKMVECTVIDMNGDGLKDIEWILTVGDDAHFRYREYQRTDGTFGDGDVVWMEAEGLVYEAK